jgi:ATP-dependent Clp protease ATP-binding subunit ClpC
MLDSADFIQVVSEAGDIAQSVAQKLTSAHVLLALFTVENRAQLVLKERGVDEDRLLEVLTQAPEEEEGLLKELYSKCREIAKNCASSEADCLHLLIAATRVRCAAQQMLLKTGIDLAALRNSALSYYLGGRMPRKLQLQRSPARPRLPPLPQQPLHSPSSAKVSVLPAARAEPAVPAQAKEEEPIAAPERAPSPPALSRLADAAEPFDSDLQGYPLLKSIGRNLTRAALEKRLDPVVGRAREIEEVIDILGKRRTNNPCLVGEPGVGKTAVVEGVAQRLLELSGPLSEKWVVELDVASLVAGTQLRGSFSEKLNALKDEVKRSEGRIVVFIDELHMLVGAGSTGEGPQDAANELKSAMARGEFPCIGATTHDEFRKFISADPALERRFTPVTVNEPSVPETVLILKGIIQRYEDHHGLRYAPKALEAAAALAAKYINDRFLPDKAISIVDLAGSRNKREGKGLVEPDDVAKVVAKLAGLPEERLLLSDTARLLKLEEELGQKVIGHREAIARIGSVVRRNYAGFASRRPMGSFLFLGPTGVGKTELARALAEVLFGNADALIQLDMSEMSEAHAISRLIGSPAGYVGHGEGGQLTEPIRRRPSSVVLLDEIEKAHRDVQLLLLQILEEGRLTDGKGRHIDFSNSVIIATTNLGSSAFDAKGRPMGFNAAASDEPDGDEGALDMVRAAMPVELWNRIDERLVFRPLRKDEVAKVAALLISESAKRLAAEKGINYSVGDDVVSHLMSAGGFDVKLGARPMRQAVQRLLEAPLAERILSGEFTSGDRVRIAVRGGKIAFERR